MKKALLFAWNVSTSEMFFFFCSPPQTHQRILPIKAEHATFTVNKKREKTPLLILKRKTLLTTVCLC